MWIGNWVLRESMYQAVHLCTKLAQLISINYQLLLKDLLTVACKGGGSSMNGVKRPYKPPLTCCCMQGVAAVRTGSKGHKSPHPTHCCMQGKWGWCERGRKAIETTSVSLLHARKVVVMQKGLKWCKTYLCLAIACKGGGSSANRVEKT